MSDTIVEQTYSEKFRKQQFMSIISEKYKNVDLNQVFIEERTKDFIKKYKELKEAAKF